jgi:hypothetical protein
MATHSPIKSLRKAEDSRRTPRRSGPEGRTRNREFDDLLSPSRSRGFRHWACDEDLRDEWVQSMRIAAEIDASAEETTRMEQSEDDIAEGRIRWEDDISDDELGR